MTQKARYLPYIGHRRQVAENQYSFHFSRIILHEVEQVWNQPKIIPSLRRAVESQPRLTGHLSVRWLDAAGNLPILSKFRLVA